MNITNEQLDRLGRLVDQAENHLAVSSLPMNPQIHIEGMRSGFVEIRDTIRKLIIEISGQDPWAGRPQ
jgi:hypothetical protein